MPIDFAVYSGKSNVGPKPMENNEDYILFNEFDDDMLLCAIADGSGSKECMFRPASMAAHQIESMLFRIYQGNRSLFKEHTQLFMEEAFLAANNTLIGFKLGNEEKHYGLATTMTCALISGDGTLTFGHAGNTRLYLVRDGKTLQLSKDHTAGQRMVDSGVMSAEEYYTAPERLSLYNGIGVLERPKVQTYQIPLVKNDVLIMTTDGIHYSYKSEAFRQVLLNSDGPVDASDQLIQMALDLKNYVDNLSVNVIWYVGRD